MVILHKGPACQRSSLLFLKRSTYNTPLASQQLGSLFGVPGKKLQRQYKSRLSGFNQWKYKAHAKEWLLYPKNIGPYLSIDETALSQGKLYTIITNKTVKGKKGALVGIFKGTKAFEIPRKN